MTTQNDKIQLRQNTKRQITNSTKLKKTKYKRDKTENDRLQIWQTSIIQKHKCDNIQKDKIRIKYIKRPKKN